MSLKAFHIIFVTASVVLCWGFGAWAIRQYQSGIGSPGDLALGVGSLVLSGVLVVYGRYFLRKLRHISYL